MKYTLSGDDKVKITTVSSTSYKVDATSAGADVYNATTKKLTTASGTTTAVDANAVLYVKVGSSYYAYNLRSAKDIKATGTAGTNDVTVNFMLKDGLVIAAYMELTAKPGTSTNNTVYGIVTDSVGTFEINNTTYHKYVVAVDDNSDNNVVVNLESADLAAGDLVYFDVDANAQYNGAANSGKDIIKVTGTAAAVKKFDAATKLITYYTSTERADINSAYTGTGDVQANTLDKDYKVIYVDKDGKKGGENIGVNEFDGTKGYANAILLDKDSDGLIDVIFVETSGKVNMASSGFGGTKTVTLVNTNGTIAAVGGTNGAYEVTPSTTTPAVGATFTVTVKCTSVDGANTKGERVTVTYNSVAKTLDFTTAGTQTVTFTAVDGQTNVTAAVAAIA